MGRSEFVTWGEELGQIASSLIRTVHAMNEIEKTPALEQLQRNLIQLACVLWAMGDRMMAVGRRSTNGAAALGAREPWA